MSSGKKEIGLYIHIPFCKAKCHYCDFNSFAGMESLVAPYFEALYEEILCYRQKLGDYRIKTIFIGGGTPSLVDTQHIYELFKRLRQSFDIPDKAETSIETNPGTLSYEKLLAYRTMGINRLSIGLQAWQERLLKYIGRIHGTEEFIENIAAAKKAGFKNINVDLIFGLPGQTQNDWIESIVNTVKRGASHISCYSLTIEEDTVFGSRLDAGELEPVDEELDRKMYWFAVERLEKFGFRHYEISNFARPGLECKHNLIYWKAEEYLGLGAGAHSYLDGERFGNIPGVEKYISAVMGGVPYAEDVQVIDKAEAMSEFMFLGLRLIDGVDKAEFKDRFGVDLNDIFGVQIEKLIKKQLLEQETDKIRLTPKGLDLANQAFVEFI